MTGGYMSLASKCAAVAALASVAAITSGVARASPLDQVYCITVDPAAHKVIYSDLFATDTVSLASAVRGWNMYVRTYFVSVAKPGTCAKLIADSRAQAIKARDAEVAAARRSVFATSAEAAHWRFQR